MSESTAEYWNGTDVRVHIPEDTDDAHRRYECDPVFCDVVRITARQSGYSRKQIVSGEGCRTIRLPAVILGLNGWIKERNEFEGVTFAEFREAHYTDEE